MFHFIYCVVIFIYERNKEMYTNQDKNNYKNNNNDDDNFCTQLYSKR